MKNMILNTVVLLAATLSPPSLLAQSGGSYDLSWSTLDGGGGTSSGGAYAVTGTIGQPDAAWPVDEHGFPVFRSTGGNYSVAGGFWGLFSVVQTPGAPRLTIINTGAASVKVCWPDPSTGWVLQQNGDLATTNWVISSLPVIVEGTNKCVTVTPPAGHRFFRLFKP
jgi:hypothetical protein